VAQCVLDFGQQQSSVLSVCMSCVSLGQFLGGVAIPMVPLSLPEDFSESQCWVGIPGRAQTSELCKPYDVPRGLVHLRLQIPAGGWNCW
jgi:hypothetical protein